MLKEISVSSSQRIEMIDITDKVIEVVRASKINSGICVVFARHTTAAITINENADPSVVYDIENKLAKLVQHRDNYHHSEGNSDAHIKSSLVGASETIIIENGKLLLGTWQGVFFCEFDGPRRRSVLVKIIGD